MFHKFNAGVLLLPKFEMTIDRSGYQKVSLGDYSEVYGISVHEALEILFCVGKVVQIELFMR